jgi:hypothetical protein
MKPTLRRSLADSHVSAVAIAMLLVWSLEFVFRASLSSVRAAIFFFFTFDPPSHVGLIAPLSYFLQALCSLAAAWFLSRWVYGEGPFRSLARYHTDLERRQHV